VAAAAGQNGAPSTAVAAQRQALDGSLRAQRPLPAAAAAAAACAEATRSCGHSRRPPVATGLATAGGSLRAPVAGSWQVAAYGETPQRSPEPGYRLLQPGAPVAFHEADPRLRSVGYPSAASPQPHARDLRPLPPWEPQVVRQASWAAPRQMTPHCQAGAGASPAVTVRVAMPETLQGGSEKWVAHRNQAAA